MKRNIAYMIVLSIILSLFSFNLVSAIESPITSPTIELTSNISNNICTVTVKLKGVTQPLMAIGLILNYDANILTYSSDINNLNQDTISKLTTTKQISATKTNSKLNIGWYTTTATKLIKPTSGEIQLCSIPFNITKTADTAVSVTSESSVVIDVNAIPEEIFINSNSINLSVKYTAPATGNPGGNAGGGSPGGGSAVVPVATPTPENTFIDLDGYDWASSAIYRLSKLGIIKGTSENTFSPANNITRADFAVLLSRTFSLKGEAKDNFNDVNNGEYFYESIGILKSLGIAQGDEGNYRPYEQITRQDIIVLTHRALTLLGNIKDAPDYDMLSKFEDRDSISSYATESVCIMIARGIIKGNDGNLSPLDNATRAEAAVIFNRIYDILPK